MNILITAATWNEIKPLEKYLQQMDADGKLKDHSMEISITGVGGVQTAFHLARMLPAGKWDLAIQLGICGSFKKEFTIGTTVNVTEERFADLGAEDGENFLDVFEIGLMEKGKPPFADGTIQNGPSGNSDFILKLPKAKGISVNKVHGNEKSIQQIISKYHPDVETMEGAAFLYCCKLMSIPCFEIRTVSNMVERRDRSKWNIGLAIENLNQAAIRIISELAASNG